jgi:hypothetical protein
VSLREDLASQTMTLISDTTDAWLDNLLSTGEGLVEGYKDKLGEAGVADAVAAMNAVGANTGPWVRLGTVGFAQVMACWEDDDAAEARRHYLSHQATFEERRRAMQLAGDAAAKDADERQAAWAEVENVLKSVTTLGLRFLVNLAARGVGLPITI